MKWLDRFAFRLPRVQKLLKTAGEAIREAALIKKESRPDDLFTPELELQRVLFRERMNEILDLRAAEVACYNPQGFETIRESWKPVATESQFKERLWELELALEDRGWVREVTLSNLEFSRLGVQQLIRIIRIMAIKNPLVKRGAEICALYVFGRGIEIRAEDETANSVIQDFMDANQAELGHVGLAQKENSTQTDGSVYFGLATAPDGSVKVQSIDPLEIMEVVTDPDDSSKPQFFYRQWTRCQFDMQTGQQTNVPTKAWYPAVEYLECCKDRPKFINDAPVNWDMPILRASGNGSPKSWRWPVPPIYAAIDWSRAYKEFLEDWATVQRSLSRFALMVETKGGPGAIASYQALLQTTFADGDGTQIERNPPPVAGSAHISGPGNTITPFKSAGAQSSPEQSRRMLLMVASALGMPETFFGDASTGSLATAQSLDRPTELKFTEIQRRWTYVVTTILKYVLTVSSTTPNGKLKEAAKSVSDARIVVKFPTVVEHDIQKMIQAITEIATMGGRNGIAAGIVDRRTIADLLLAEIGVENRDELLDNIYGKRYDASEDVTDQRSQPSPQQITTPLGKALTDLSKPPPLPEPPAPAVVPPVPGAKPAVKAKPAEALREALSEIQKFLESVHAKN